MNTFKKALTIALLAGASPDLQAQINCSVQLKPNPVIGQDAQIFTLGGGCNPAPANTNYGNATELAYAAWDFTPTWGCSNGLIRSLLRFSELTNPAIIPSNATIVNADLRLFGVPPGGNTIPAGNSGFNGGLIKLIPNSMTWAENSINWVIWQSMAAGAGTTGDLPLAPGLGISPSTSTWNWNYATPLSPTWIQNVVNGTAVNNGYLLLLRTEQLMRSTLFASSDNPNPALWPELRVNYSVPCPATHFTYCRFSDQPYRIDMSVNTVPTLPPCGGQYRWKIDNVVMSTAATYSHMFAPPPSTPGSQNHTLTFEIVDANGIVACKTEREICLYLNPTKYSGNSPCIDFKACINTAIPKDMDVTPLSQPGGTYSWAMSSPGVPTYITTVVDPPVWTYSGGPVSIAANYWAASGKCNTQMQICLGGNEKPDRSTSIAKLTNDNNASIALIPNPAIDEVTIIMNKATKGAVQIKLVDVSGKTVLRQAGIAGTTSFETKLSISGIPAGIYILEVLNNGNVQREKLIKQ
ncbi:MAG: T9SS type A sorting domain-containing protein [Sphingobacteriales bacterium]|nr:MAG: T9SS type A sorting domain-containing protein [Sphingobacteriales bacterium]